MRTTVDISEEIYKKLVELSIEKYGNARNISKVLNEILNEVFVDKKRILESIFGSWKNGKIEDLRERSSKEWEERVKRLVSS